MMDLSGAVILGAVTGLVLFVLAQNLQLSRPAQVIFAIGSGAWVGFVAFVGSLGVLAATEPFPIMGAFVAAPLVAATLGAALSPAFRTALMRIPTDTIVALNIARIFGGFFILLALQGRLAGPFPYSAGWGDVLTGVVALWMVLTPSIMKWKSLLQLWNAFGALDLIVALSLGVLSAKGSPVQLIEAGIGSEAVQYMPWALIPAVLVPIYLILHAVVFAQGLQRRNALAAI